jgi:hypothetical protein
MAKAFENYSVNDQILDLMLNKISDDVKNNPLKYQQDVIALEI